MCVCVCVFVCVCVGMYVCVGMCVCVRVCVLVCVYVNKSYYSIKTTEITLNKTLVLFKRYEFNSKT